MPDHVMFVQKTATAVPLMVLLRAVLVALESLPPTKTSTLGARIWNALEASPTIGGFGVDIKKLIARGRKNY